MADDDLRRLVYETYFSLPPWERQDVEWVITPDLWKQIRKLQSRHTPFCLPHPDGTGDLLIGHRVRVDDLADGIELRAPLNLYRTVTI